MCKAACFLFVHVQHFLISLGAVKSALQVSTAHSFTRTSIDFQKKATVSVLSSYAFSFIQYVNQAMTFCSLLRLASSVVVGSN